ncbi:porin [Octadecabacter sp. SW4]|uniref:porin n=1 Tax=Octadecabacter sp. SW4 TaxID=2602067 RepID=UPI0011C20941|nr:porin [Octadecabacter sp. SW4]QEE36946.1 porin [Octadecabacter sp. SW4]
MKSILLASTAVIALAGAAAAEVSFGGEATLGYNDFDNGTGDNFGFYWEANIAVTLSQTLDNGLTAGATFDFDVAATNLGTTLTTGGYVLFVESDTAGLFFGDTAFAAETRWVSAGDMEADGFSEADGEVALRGDISYGPVEASVSYVLAESGGTINMVDDLNQLSLGMVATFGNFDVAVAYQEASGEAGGFYAANGDFSDDEIFGISVGAAFAGADFRLAYASNETSGEDSTGLSVSYPVGPVVLGAYYVSESDPTGDNWGINVAYENGPISVGLDYQDDQGVEKIEVEGSYDVGNGLMVYAGYLTEDGTEDRFYVAGGYDLGGGASLLVSYAEDDDNVDEDEIGAGEYQVGTTVEVSFEF